MARRLFLVIAVLALCSAHAWAAPADKADPAGTLSLEGYAEWREGPALIVDGQRLVLGPAGRFEGARGIQDFASVPLGWEVKAKGRRASDGTVQASEVEAKPNGDALFEKKVLRLTDEAEAKYRRAGRYYTTGKRARTIGRITDSGNEVLRVQRIVRRLVPPYVDPDRVRVYIVQNDDWNAFAMGNFAIYVYSGLLRDMDDEEVAIVIGHELAHATYEHTRKRLAKTMFVELAALGVTAAAHKSDNRKERAVLGLLTAFSALALVNGYGRDLEDQADRVGLRYAYEGGYDVRRGPPLWRRFAKKYGDKGSLANFFFGNHSLSSERAVNLEKEIALNYPEKRP